VSKMFSDLDTDAGLLKLNEYLMDASFVKGYVVGNERAEVEF